MKCPQETVPERPCRRGQNRMLMILCGAPPTAGAQLARRRRDELTTLVSRPSSAAMPSKRKPPPPRVGKPASRKLVALSLLVGQNASIAVLTRLSRLPRSAHAGEGAAFEPFVASTAVFVAEVIKLSASLGVATTLRRSEAAHKKSDDVEKKRRPGWAASAKGALREALGPGTGREVMRVSVPAVLYAVQNNLLYIALSNLDPATYSVIYQMKILSAALFSVVLFRRPLSAPKWLSLVLLTAGVALVQMQSSDGGRAPKRTDIAQSPTKGFLAIVAACLSSGLAGSWFEMVLKSSSTTGRKGPAPSLWTRNIQLSVPSLVFTAAAVALDPSAVASIRRKGFFAGYDSLTWFVIVNQALGGLLVALVVREADSVSKGFATSLAVVGPLTFPFDCADSILTSVATVSTAVSSIVFDFVPGLRFLLGAALVLFSTVMFAFVA